MIHYITVRKALGPGGSLAGFLGGPQKELSTVEAQGEVSGEGMVKENYFLVFMLILWFLYHSCKGRKGITMHFVLRPNPGLGSRCY